MKPGLLWKIIITTLIIYNLITLGLLFQSKKSSQNQFSANIKLPSTVTSTIFQRQNNFPSSKPPTFWSLLLTGDIIPARAVNAQMVKKNDFSWPLVNIAPVLKDADVTLINLEAPLLKDCPVTQEGMKFCGDARFAASLADSGVD